MTDRYQAGQGAVPRGGRIAEANERDAFLEKECAGDAALLERVNALLAADRDEDSLLDQSATAAAVLRR